jgi:hypothetical protein
MRLPVPLSSRAVVCLQLLESMLSKLVEEFENRLNSQNELVCLVFFVRFLSVVYESLLHTTYGIMLSEQLTI